MLLGNMLIRSPAIWCAFTIGALTCPAGLLEAHQAGFSVPIFRALREGKGWSLSYLVPTCFPSYAATVSRLNAQTLPPNRYGVAFFCVLLIRCDILYMGPFTVALLVTVHGLSFQ